jgi:hypothetical protein
LKREKMQEIKKRGLTLMFLLVLAFSQFSLLSTASAEDDEWSETWEITYGENDPGVTPLTDKEREACPDDATGFIYNSYSVFTYYKGDNPDGKIRFSDTVHYFNTVNEDVTFTFKQTPFHEARPHTIPLPNVISKDFMFYPISNEIEYLDLPESLTVPSMHKGELELIIEIDEAQAYEIANNGGLIGLVSGTPNFATDVGGGVKVTSVPAYKIFMVLMSDDNIIETQGGEDKGDDITWILYAIGIIAIVCLVIFFILRNIEYVEVEEE